MEFVLVLKDSHREEMINHLTGVLPEEGCGMVGGRDGTAESVFAVTNSLHSPVQFRMDPEEQLNVLMWLDENEMDLVAIYHSHPNGPLKPSQKDIAEFSYPGVVSLIWAFTATGWVVRGCLIEGDSFREIPIKWINGMD